ncbi:hypothetical protein AB0910_21150 [Streptomyces sp. NPDC047002]|uniref:hypothetical protein n=1 Tax=Streptomyces sp. NPDC047002 TaxID=3155475 RepID=UPI0034514219
MRAAPPLLLKDLTSEQRRGGSCAYCDRQVSTRTAVPIEPRHDANGVRLFLRAHPACVRADS